MACKCDKCEKEYGVALKTYTKPNKYWLIPFVAWFIITYDFFTEKNTILLYKDNKPMGFKQFMFEWWIFLGPFFLFFLIMHLISTY